MGVASYSNMSSTADVAPVQVCTSIDEASKMDTISLDFLLLELSLVCCLDLNTLGHGY